MGLYSLGDMDTACPQQGDMDTARPQPGEATESLNVPSAHSTCVGSDIEPESFVASLENSGTSFIDQGTRTCVMYAMSDAGEVVDKCADICDMYESKWEIAHTSSHPTHA